MATRLVGIAENLSLWAGSIVQFLLYSVRRLYKAWAKRNSTSEKKKIGHIRNIFSTFNSP